MAGRPLRIALVYDAVYPYQKGGGERRFRELAELLTRRGCEVDLYGMRSWPAAGPVPVSVRLRIHGLCRARPLYTASGRRSIVQGLLFGLACLKLLSRRFDVIDCCGFPFFSLFACKLVAVVRRKPLVSTWHEVWGPAYWREYLGPTAGRVGALVERLAVTLPDRIICVSRTTGNRIRLELGCRKPVFLLPNGVDIRLATAVRPTGSTVDVVFAGRLIAEKNVDLLLRALARLAVEASPVRCLIVGDGPERGRLERLRAELGLASSVTFAGHLPSSRDVLAAMKSAKVLVLPSRREGFGMVVLEANACGLPVITVRHPGNAAAELVHDGRNGWVVPVDDAALAGAVRAAVTRPPLPGVGERVGEYSWERLAERYALTALYQVGIPAAADPIGDPIGDPVGDPPGPVPIPMPAARAE
jgi:glycosyltransferase involved in cell wall biosynthesis